jgi:hypothetical protein
MPHPNRLAQSEAAHEAALRTLAQIVADLADLARCGPIEREAIVDAFVELGLDGDPSLDRIDGTAGAVR